MDITGSNSKLPVVDSKILSAGSVTAKAAPDIGVDLAADRKIESAVDESQDATDAVLALARGVEGVTDLYVTSQPSRKVPLRQELSALAEQLGITLQKAETSEVTDTKLQALAQRLSSIFGDDEAPPPAVSKKEFILGILSQVAKADSRRSEATSREVVEKQVADENQRAASASVKEVDDLVLRIAAASTQDRQGLLAAFKAPDIRLLVG